MLRYKPRLFHGPIAGKLQGPDGCALECPWITYRATFDYRVFNRSRSLEIDRTVGPVEVRGDDEFCSAPLQFACPNYGLKVTNPHRTRLSSPSKFTLWVYLQQYGPMRG